jgi:hypothetical protein
LEQQLINLLPIAERQAIEIIVGDREYNLKIIDFWEQQFRSLVEPIGTLGTRTLRAVAIGTRVVHIGFIVAPRTLVDATAERCGAAQQDPRKDVLDLLCPAIVAHEAGGVRAQNGDNT